MNIHLIRYPWEKFIFLPVNNHDIGNSLVKYDVDIVVDPQHIEGFLNYFVANPLDIHRNVYNAQKRVTYDYHSVNDVPGRQITRPSQAIQELRGTLPQIVSVGMAINSSRLRDRNIEIEFDLPLDPHDITRTNRLVLNFHVAYQYGVQLAASLRSVEQSFRKFANAWHDNRDKLTALDLINFRDFDYTMPEKSRGFWQQLDRTILQAYEEHETFAAIEKMFR